jgi:hypothetical protein
LHVGEVLVAFAQVVHEAQVDVIHVGELGGRVAVDGEGRHGVETIVGVVLHLAVAVVGQEAVVGRVEAVGEQRLELVARDRVLEQHAAIEVVDLGDAAIGLIGQVVQRAGGRPGRVASLGRAVEHHLDGVKAGRQAREVEAEDISGRVDGN